MNQSMFYNYVSTDMANPMLAVRPEGDPLKALAPSSVTEGYQTREKVWVGVGVGRWGGGVYK